MTSDHDDFWGDQADWPTASVPLTTPDDVPPTDRPAPRRPTLRDRWNGVLGGGVNATREHRRVDAAGGPAADRPPDAPLDEPEAGVHHAEVGDVDLEDIWADAGVARGWTTTPAAAALADDASDDGAPASAFGDDDLDADDLDADDAAGLAAWGRNWVPADQRYTPGGIDPRLFRVGVVAVIVTLLVPLVAAFRSAGDDDFDTLTSADPTVETNVTTTEVAPPPSSAAPLVTPVDDDASTAAAAPSPSRSNTSASTVPVPVAGESGDGDAEEQPVVAADELSESAMAEQACATDYEVSEGDFWIRLADAAGVDLADLLAVNAATIDTPLYPGRSICLPAGASTPAPPSPPVPATTTPPTTAAPTTAAPTTAAPTTAAPTTAAPTTQPPPPPPAPEEVERIIREVWPDELEERALQIAWRESGYQADVRNYCCFGLFQIYWEVHRGWLADMGVTSAEQLYDAETNTRAAYALYERSGGWGPWT
jgi:LysM repeat protein